MKQPWMGPAFQPDPLRLHGFSVLKTIPLRPGEATVAHRKDGELAKSERGHRVHERVDRPLGALWGGQVEDAQ